MTKNHEMLMMFLLIRELIFAYTLCRPEKFSNWSIDSWRNLSSPGWNSPNASIKYLLTILFCQLFLFCFFSFEHASLFLNYLHA